MEQEDIILGVPAYSKLTSFTPGEIPTSQIKIEFESLFNATNVTLNSPIKFNLTVDLYNGSSLENESIRINYLGKNTNWTLNPNHKKNFNENPNTKEGFRKVDDDNSVFETLKKSQKKKRVVCIGGSTTMCEEMASYKESWPSLLNKKLGNKKFQVFK